MYRNEGVAQLAAGTIIQLNRIAQLPAFEDWVAEQVDPNMTDPMRVAWAGRLAIEELVRPAKFYRTIANIQLAVMENPYERLCDARDRGWEFPHTGSTFHTGSKTNDEEVIRSYHGYTLFADAISTGKREKAQIQAELWFGGISVWRAVRDRIQADGSTVVDPYNVKKSPNNGGASVRRIVTKPKLVKTGLIVPDKTAQTVGLEALLQDEAE